MATNFPRFTCSKISWVPEFGFIWFLFVFEGGGNIWLWDVFLWCCGRPPNTRPSFPSKKKPFFLLISSSKRYPALNLFRSLQAWRFDQPRQLFAQEDFASPLPPPVHIVRRRQSFGWVFGQQRIEVLVDWNVYCKRSHMDHFFSQREILQRLGVTSTAEKLQALVREGAQTNRSEFWNTPYSVYTGH